MYYACSPGAEPRCNFWLDSVHLTKTSHQLVADFLVHAITITTSDSEHHTDEGRVHNYPTAILSLPPKLNMTLENLLQEVKKLLPSKPVSSISFRTHPLPLPEELAMGHQKHNSSGIVCFEGFQPNNNRGRLSARARGGEMLGNNTASFVLRLPLLACNIRPTFTAFRLSVEFLNSYLTTGMLDLFSWNGTHNVSSSDCSTLWKKYPLSDDGNPSMNMTDDGSFNATNGQKLSVSKTLLFPVDKDDLYVGGQVRGGDFQLLSLKGFCT